LHGIAQGAGFFAYVAAEYFMTRAPESFLARNPGKISRSFIEKADPPVLIDTEDSLVKAGENGLKPFVG
jgi:hypothetical protein